MDDEGFLCDFFLEGVIGEVVTRVASSLATTGVDGLDAAGVLVASGAIAPSIFGNMGFLDLVGVFPFVGVVVVLAGAALGVVVVFGAGGALVPDVDEGDEDEDGEEVVFGITEMLEEKDGDDVNPPLPAEANVGTSLSSLDFLSLGRLRGSTFVLVLLSLTKILFSEHLT